MHVEQSVRCLSIAGARSGHGEGPCGPGSGGVGESTPPRVSAAH